MTTTAAHPVPGNETLEVARLHWDLANLEESISRCFYYAECVATGKITWYRKKKKSKQLNSKLLRGFAIVLGIAGGICPIIDTVSRMEIVKLGYVFFGIAGGLVLFDKLFGVSSSWMRFMLAASQLEYALDVLRLDWAQILVNKENNSSEALAHEQLGLIKHFLKEVHTIVIGETKQWMTQFEKDLVHLENIMVQRRSSQEHEAERSVSRSRK
jgi:hypothetical protein